MITVLAVTSGHVRGGHVAHIPRACGANGVTTKCGVLIPHRWNTTRVEIDDFGAMTTAQNDAPCKVCFGDGR